jgi:uncharacterized membrane protein/tRNA A-37 threonylcarbamoyl transferase component Bud32
VLLITLGNEISKIAGVIKRNPESRKMNHNDNDINKSKSTRRDNRDACLSYSFGWITGLIFYFIRKDSKYVRFHAMQSIIFFGSLYIFLIFLLVTFNLIFTYQDHSRSDIGAIFAVLLTMATLYYFIVWIILIAQSARGKKEKLPIIAELAENLIGGTMPASKNNKITTETKIAWVLFGLCVLFFGLSWTQNNTLTTTSAILFYICFVLAILVLAYSHWVKKRVFQASAQPDVVKSADTPTQDNNISSAVLTGEAEVPVPSKKRLSQIRKDATTIKTGAKQKRRDNLINNRYEIVKVHKTGGMAIINLSKDYETNSQCIIKIPRQGTEHDQINIDKLKFEADYLKNYRHEYILKFIDFFTHNNMPHLVVEYIEGEDLFSKFQFMPAQEKRVLKWAKQILEALEEIHLNGYFHRDIKPGNVMLKGNDDIVFIDFGTLKPFDGRGTTIIMSPLFAAPEQIQGISDGRSDIYGVGGILLYLLTCTAPGKLGEMGRYDIKELLLSKDISANTATCIAQALQLDPKYRYQSTKAMRRALFPGA